MLVSHKIETYEQLLFYKDTINQDIKDLTTKRENLWRKIKRTKSNDEKISIRNEIDTLTKLLAPKRKEVVLCEGIEKRLNAVKENIKEFEEEKGKERLKDELK